MKGIALSLPIAVVLVACAAQLPSVTEPRANEEPPCGGERLMLGVTNPSELDFGLSLDPSSSGSQVVLRLAIQNVSTRPIALRPRIGLDQQREGEATIRFEVLRVSPSSEPAPACVLREAPASEPYFELGPGARYSFQAEIVCDRPLDEGRWRISARYFDPEHPEVLFDFWFAGTLDSNTIELDVEPRGSISEFRPEDANLCEP